MLDVVALALRLHPFEESSPMMSRPALVAGLALLVIVPSVYAVAAHNRQASAAIADESARATALALVPGGIIKEGELETENGKLVYSYDIEVPGQPGVEEVQVDAMTGAVVSRTHETDEDEKAEADDDEDDDDDVKPPRAESKPRGG